MKRFCFSLTLGIYHSYLECELHINSLMSSIYVIGGGGAKRREGVKVNSGEYRWIRTIPYSFLRADASNLNGMGLKGPIPILIYFLETFHLFETTRTYLHTSITILII